MIKFIERKVRNVPGYEGQSYMVMRVMIQEDDKQYSYHGTFSLPVEEWEKLKACLEVGAEENPVGFEYSIENGD